MSHVTVTLLKRPKVYAGSVFFVGSKLRVPELTAQRWAALGEAKIEVPETQHRRTSRRRKAK